VAQRLERPADTHGRSCSCSSRALTTATGATRGACLCPSGPNPRQANATPAPAIRLRARAMRRHVQCSGTGYEVDALARGGVDSRGVFGAGVRQGTQPGCGPTDAHLCRFSGRDPGTARAPGAVGSDAARARRDSDLRGRHCGGRDGDGCRHSARRGRPPSSRSMDCREAGRDACRRRGHPAAFRGRPASRVSAPAPMRALRPEPSGPEADMD
jgi:hypothetical protein